MLRNLILAIFLLALALPTVAMPIAAQDAPVTTDCHGQPVKQDSGGHDGTMMKTHNCIGCIAPCISAPVAPLVVALPFIVEAQAISELSGTTPPPSLPPPRG